MVAERTGHSNGRQKQQAGRCFLHVEHSVHRGWNLSERRRRLKIVLGESWERHGVVADGGSGEIRRARKVPAARGVSCASSTFCMATGRLHQQCQGPKWGIGGELERDCVDVEGSGCAHGFAEKQPGQCLVHVEHYVHGDWVQCEQL